MKKLFARLAGRQRSVAEIVSVFTNVVRELEEVVKIKTAEQYKFQRLSEEARNEANAAVEHAVKLRELLPVSAK